MTEDGTQAVFTEPPTKPTSPATVPSEPTEPQPTTEQPALSPDGIYVYMRNVANWNGVYCYYWSDSEGEAYPRSGVKMEYVTDNIYRYEVNNKYQNIIFNNGQGIQTADLRVSYNHIYNNSTNQWEPFA